MRDDRHSLWKWPRGMKLAAVRYRRPQGRGYRKLGWMARTLGSLLWVQRTRRRPTWRPRSRGRRWDSTYADSQLQSRSGGHELVDTAPLAIFGLLEGFRAELVD